MKNKHIEVLHKRNLSLFRKYQSIEGELLDTLQDFDRCRGYQHYGHSDLFSYCVQTLKMSQSQAFTFIRVSRKAVEVPKLKEAVQSKKISISSAKVIASVITPQNQQDWITKAETLSKSDLEREITKINPKAIKAVYRKERQDKKLRPTSHSEKISPLGLLTLNSFQTLLLSVPKPVVALRVFTLLSVFHMRLSELSKIVFRTCFMDALDHFPRAIINLR